MTRPRLLQEKWIDDKKSQGGTHNTANEKTNNEVIIFSQTPSYKIQGGKGTAIKIHDP